MGAVPAQGGGWRAHRARGPAPAPERPGEPVHTPPSGVPGGVQLQRGEVPAGAGERVRDRGLRPAVRGGAVACAAGCGGVRTDEPPGPEPVPGELRRDELLQDVRVPDGAGLPAGTERRGRAPAEDVLRRRLGGDRELRDGLLQDEAALQREVRGRHAGLPVHRPARLRARGAGAPGHGQRAGPRVGGHALLLRAARRGDTLQRLAARRLLRRARSRRPRAPGGHLHLQPVRPTRALHRLQHRPIALLRGQFHDPRRLQLQPGRLPQLPRPQRGHHRGRGHAENQLRGRGRPDVRQAPRRRPRQLRLPHHPGGGRPLRRLPRRAVCRLRGPRRRCFRMSSFFVHHTVA